MPAAERSLCENRGPPGAVAGARAQCGRWLAPDETDILLHPPLTLVGVSIVMERERQENDSQWLKVVPRSDLHQRRAGLHLRRRWLPRLLPPDCRGPCRQDVHGGVLADAGRRPAGADRTGRRVLSSVAASALRVHFNVKLRLR